MVRYYLLKTLFQPMEQQALKIWSFSDGNWHTNLLPNSQSEKMIKIKFLVCSRLQYLGSYHWSLAFLAVLFSKRKSFLSFSTILQHCYSFIDVGSNSFAATSKVKTLQTIIGDHNKIKKIPAQTFAQDALFSINISHNSIKHLPKTVYKKPVAFLNARYED